jgi:hypothetical protein
MPLRFVYNVSLEHEVLRACLVPVSAIVWSIAYSYNPLGAIKLAFLMVFRDYLLVGVVVASILWYAVAVLVPASLLTHYRLFSNRVLVSPPSHSTPADSSVEWAYAFDVHTNAFFPLCLALYLAQPFLLPILLKDNWVCIWVGNTLYLAA